MARKALPRPPRPSPRAKRLGVPDLLEIAGLDTAKRALEVALAGGHHLLLTGPSGVGKTMLARSVPALLPPLAPGEAKALEEVYGLAGQDRIPGERPFRTPHTRATARDFFGGPGARPGEVSLAHAGALLLDDLPLYRPELIEALRQPLDTGEIASKGPGPARLPARFSLIAALNSCPCGSFGDPAGRCRCSVHALLRYRAVLSLPWLDRIDLRVQVERPSGNPAGHRGFEPDGSEAVAGRIARARATQWERFGEDCAAPFNAAMANREVLAHCPLGGRAEEIAKVFYNRQGTSTRAWFAILRVARTVADLEGRNVIDGHALAEAVQYRWWTGFGREDSRWD